MIWVKDQVLLCVLFQDFISYEDDKVKGKFLKEAMKAHWAADLPSIAK